MLLTVVSWILFGYAVRLISRPAFPGLRVIGFVETVAFGALGAFIGCSIASLAAGEIDLYEFRPSGLLGSFVGSLGIVAMMSVTSRGYTA